MEKSMEDNPSVSPVVSAGTGYPERSEDRTGNAAMIGPRRPGKCEKKAGIVGWKKTKQRIAEAL
jgi:hypothetical protein